MRVIMYARYSSDKQRESAIEDQVRLCEERARLTKQRENIIQAIKDGLPAAEVKDDLVKWLRGLDLFKDVP